MRWITREHPKIDRVACPWLIVRFIDPTPEFLFAPPALVRERAAELDAISLGLSQLFHNDHDLLGHGFVIYHALYAWLRHAKRERHTWNPQLVPTPA